ncbi:MAG: MotA/TolQ/ExbB proton channel family protein [Deferrisomatales bacterium]|nr:MotA/TolQ/ExbB proton channel family protein [Deferrisomatales bacterium]
MYEYVLKGGVLMIPIVGCSIIAVAVFLERAWTLRGSRNLPKELARRAEELIRRGLLEEAMAVCRRSPSPMGAVIQAALRHAGQGRDAVKEAVEEVGRREAAHLERYVGILGTVANVAPLLGLLGTVSGMIKAFTVISVQGVGNPASLAGGISEALITTAAGLTVAIPTFVAYRYFLGKLDRIILGLEQYALHFVDLVKNADLRSRVPSRAEADA